MSCYFIAQLRIHDRAGYRRYEDGFDEAFAGHDGEVLVVDETPTVLEGHWGYTRVVVIRFPDERAARRWYDSPAYQALARLRFLASTGDAILARGGD